MPRRPRPLHEALEDRWNGSTCVTLKGSGETLQVAGLESPTRTLFVRRWLLDSVPTEAMPSIAQVVEQVLHEPCLRDSLDCDNLRKLGAIWILDSSAVDRPQNKPTWQRWTMNGPLHRHMILRIHSRPPRFTPRDSAWNIASAIVHQDEMRGCAIVDKPDGLPSHGTVDNAVENVLSYFQNFYQAATMTSEGTSPTHVSLPHRLDIETSGLLLVATNKRFASYASRLFEHGSVTKHYRCLLFCPSLEHWQHLVQLQQSSAIVTHYLDAKSSAPKRFAAQIPSNHDSNSSWLECRLRIKAVGSLQIWNGGVSVSEVQIELLTGRTHQIRGQMAALGCPIVGDPLYGRSTVSDDERASDYSFLRSRGTSTDDHHHNNNNTDYTTVMTPRMALQCCRLAFSLPDPITYQPLADQQLLVELDRAWWSESLARSTQLTKETNDTTHLLEKMSKVPISR